MDATSRLQTLSGALLLATAALVLAACGGGGGGGPGGSSEIMVDLTSVGPSGTTGTVSLTPSGSETTVVVEAIIPSGGGQQGAAIHAGTCDSVGEKLHEFPPLEEGLIALTLDVPRASLFETPHVVVVTEAPESDKIIACANIEE